MDPVDKKILESLQENGRMSNVELSRKSGLAPSSMLSRVRRLEEKGIVSAYRAILDPKSLGYNIQAFMTINLNQHQVGTMEGFEAKIKSIPEVRAAYHVTGRYDYLLLLVLRDIDHLGDLMKQTLSKIPGLERQETFLIFSTVKEDAGLSLEDL